MSTKTATTKPQDVMKVARTTNAKTLLHFMMIRDEIGMLPRPNIRPQKSGAPATPIALKSKWLRGKSDSDQSSNHTLAQACETVDLLITRLEAYEDVIKKVDRIAHHALNLFDKVDVGGRKPDILINAMAVEIATDYKGRKGKFPTGKYLRDLVRAALFKRDPQSYIDRVKKGHDEKVVALDRRDPRWFDWEKYDGPISEKSMHNILVALRLAEKK